MHMHNYQRVNQLTMTMTGVHNNDPFCRADADKEQSDKPWGQQTSNNKESRTKDKERGDYYNQLMENSELHKREEQLSKKFSQLLTKESHLKMREQ